MTSLKCEEKENVNFITTFWNLLITNWDWRGKNVFKRKKSIDGN